MRRQSKFNWIKNIYYLHIYSDSPCEHLNLVLPGNSENTSILYILYIAFLRFTVFWREIEFSDTFILTFVEIHHDNGSGSTAVQVELTDVNFPLSTDRKILRHSNFLFVKP